MQRIGVLQFAPQYHMFNTFTLKKYLLFFDKLVCHEASFNEFQSLIKIYNQFNSSHTLFETDTLNEFRQLEDLGLLEKISVNKIQLEPLINKESLTDLYIIQKEYENVCVQLMQERPILRFEDHPNKTLLSKKGDLKEKLEVLKTMITLQINEIDKIYQNEYVPIFTQALKIENIKLTNKKTQVLKVLFDNFLVPDGDIPFQQFIEIKQDSDLQLHFHALRLFISELSLGSLSLIDINEKICLLLENYNRALKFHKSKLKFSTLEIVLTTSLDFIFIPITGLPVAGTRALFSLLKSNIQFYESQMNLPGKEVAYISKVNERLKKS